MCPLRACELALYFPAAYGILSVANPSPRELESPPFTAESSQSLFLSAPLMWL